jgi:hypothetical protein
MATKVQFVAFVVFWNDRRTLGDRVKFEVAPIIRRYSEPLQAPLDALVVLKSIVSDGSTVKTNIQEVVSQMKPARVIVASPVVLSGAPDRVREEFDSPLAERFEFVYLAEDDVRDERGMVVPGIGGEVYRLLGLGGKAEALRYRPRILDERRAQLGL